MLVWPAPWVSAAVVSFFHHVLFLMLLGVDGGMIIWKPGRFALIIGIPGVILNKRQNPVGQWPVPFCLEEEVRSQANCPAGD